VAATRLGPMSTSASDTPRLRIVTKRTCGFCVAAKRMLDGLGLDYDEIDVTMDAAHDAELRKATGWPTVPIISVGDRLIGGYMELASLHRDGGLEELVRG